MSTKDKTTLYVFLKNRDYSRESEAEGGLEKFLREGKVLIEGKFVNEKA